MLSQTTEGVQVKVEVFYQEQHSKPIEGEYFFSYRITIQNLGDEEVQLKDRHWDIFDTEGSVRSVDGEGVVGRQPLIAPNKQYQYVSGCNLNSEIGFMQGYYVMQRTSDGSKFKVAIPRFELVVPAKLN